MTLQRSATTPKLHRGRLLQLLLELLALSASQVSREPGAGGAAPLPERRGALLGLIVASGLCEAAAVLEAGTLAGGVGLAPEDRAPLAALAEERPGRLSLGSGRHHAAWEAIEADTTLVWLRRQPAFSAPERELLQGVAQLLRLQWQQHQAWEQAQRAQRQAIDQAEHDPLTGLPNRIAALRHLEATLSCSAATGTSLDPSDPDGQGALVVLFIDLDHFKRINNAHGHRIGDHFLITVSKILRAVAAADDLVARLAADEFVLIRREREPGDSRPLADRLIAEISRPMTIGSCLLSHSASIGIAPVDRCARAETVIENADLAMMEAKRLGRGRASRFDLQLRALARARSGAEDALKQAIRRRELCCWFQPIVQLPSRRICGFEALARWQDPVRGIISPAEFIPLAEGSGLITEIDTLMIDQACSALAGWHHLKGGAALHISANLSARSLHDPQIGSRIASALQQSRLGSDALNIEITETMLVENLDSATRTMDQLRRLGVKLAIDDFGTGYSSLRYLKQFPVGFLKIDKSFIDGLGQAGHDDVIVAAVIRMANALGLQVIAEGVEQEAQAELLSALGCSFAQGYLFGRPMDAAAATTLLQQSLPQPSS